MYPLNIELKLSEYHLYLKCTSKKYLTLAMLNYDVCWFENSVDLDQYSPKLIGICFLIIELVHGLFSILTMLI